MTAPSNLEESHEPVLLAQAFTYSHSYGAMQGALIHAFFEQVKWIEEFKFDHQQLRQIALSTLPPEALQHVSIDKSIEEFAKLLELTCVRASISRKRYQTQVLGQIADRVEIDNERAISLVMGQKLVAGTIDRLAVLFRNERVYGAEIFDYKTDRLDSQLPLLWLDERIRHHRSQLEIYARVVSELFDLPREKISTYLVMLGSNDLVLCEKTSNVP